MIGYNDQAFRLPGEIVKIRKEVLVSGNQSSCGSIEQEEFYNNYLNSATRGSMLF